MSVRKTSAGGAAPTGGQSGPQRPPMASSHEPVSPAVHLDAQGVAVRTQALRINRRDGAEGVGRASSFKGRIVVAAVRPVLAAPPPPPPPQQHPPQSAALPHPPPLEPSSAASVDSNQSTIVSAPSPRSANEESFDRRSSITPSPLPVVQKEVRPPSPISDKVDDAPKVDSPKQKALHEPEPSASHTEQSSMKDAPLLRTAAHSVENGPKVWVRGEDEEDAPPLSKPAHPKPNEGRGDAVTFKLDTDNDDNLGHGDSGDDSGNNAEANEQPKSRASRPNAKTRSLKWANDAELVLETRAQTMFKFNEPVVNQWMDHKPRKKKAGLFSCFGRKRQDDDDDEEDEIYPG